MNDVNQDFEHDVDLCVTNEDYVCGQKDREPTCSVFDRGDEMDDVPIKDPELDGTSDIERSLANIHNTRIDWNGRVECITRHQGSINHKATMINIHILNPFH